MTSPEVVLRRRCLSFSGHKRYPRDYDTLSDASDYDIFEETLSKKETPRLFLLSDFSSVIPVGLTSLTLTKVLQETLVMILHERTGVL